MAGYVFLGALAAFGLFSILWALLGWLLPGDRGAALVCLEEADEGLLSRYKWLRGMGLLSCPLLVVTENDLVQPEGCEIEICSREALFQRLELERKKIDGTGNGDSSGRDQRRGVSEL